MENVFTWFPKIKDQEDHLELSFLCDPPLVFLHYACICPESQNLVLREEK